MTSLSSIPVNWVDSIGMVENAAYLNNLGANVNSLTAGSVGGAFSSRPSAGNTGALYFCTDSGVLFEDNGTTWVPVRINGDTSSAMGAVPTSGWTAVNMLSGSSWSADHGDMLFTASSSQTSVGFQYRTYPTPPFTLTAYLEATYLNWANLPTSASTQFQGGLAISDGTKYELFGPFAVNVAASAPWNAGAGWYVGALYYPNSSTYGSAYNSQASSISNNLSKMPRWFRYSDDGTNKTYSVSFNGVDWVPIATATHTNNLTPTRIGVYGANSGGQSGLIRVRSWNGVS